MNSRSQKGRLPNCESGSREHSDDTFLAGKVALVTGAAKGIGAGIAKAMSFAGASVAVNFASDRAGAERVVADIKAAGGKAFAILTARHWGSGAVVD